MYGCWTLACAKWILADDFMVQGRMVKISYKSKKCLRQSPENWVVIEGTHEPIIDPETF